jgi:hypothetical protein
VQTLAERIEREGPVNELDAVGWAIRLAKRLEALHALGVFHGSVSPSCVVTEASERASRGRLADVRTTSSDVAYQSPERVLGGDLSAADDAWAVAGVLYALLTGASPFAAGSPDETKQKILAAAPAPLAVFDVGDDDLQHVLDAAFTRDMSQRTSTVVGLRKKLEEWHPDPKVRHLTPLEDDEEVSTSDDDERTMLRQAPVFPTRGGPGSSPRAGALPPARASAPRAAGSVPRAAPSAPRAPHAPHAPLAHQSTPRAGDVGQRPPASAPKAAPLEQTVPLGQAAPLGHAPPPPISAHGSGRGAGAPLPPSAMAAFDFADPATPLVSGDAPIFAAAPEPSRVPLHAALAAALDPPTPEIRVEPAAPVAPILHATPQPSPAARPGMLPDPTDDDEEVKTVMREFPSNIADAARAAVAGFGSASGAPSSGSPFAPRAIGGTSGDALPPPRPAAGRPPLNQTSPMPALFSPPRPGAGPQLAPPNRPPEPVDDDDASDLQATVMREMPALPPDVAKRLDAALGPMPARPMWPTSPLMNDPTASGLDAKSAYGGPMHGVPPSMHGAPGSMQPGGPVQRSTGPMPIAGPMPGASGSPTAPSPPMGYGAPYSQTPPSNPLPTQAMPAWNSGHTAPLQPVPPLPGVNAPMPGAPMPSGFGGSAGYAVGDMNPPSRPGFPAPAMSVNQPTPSSQWMQPPPPPGAPTFDTGSIDSDPFRQRGRGVTVAAVFALVLAAAVTFAVVRYLL